MPYGLVAKVCVRLRECFNQGLSGIFFLIIPCYVPGSVPVKCEVHYTNRCDEKVAWKCDIRCSGGFVPRVSLVMLAIACPVCWQICLCIRQSVKDYPGLPSSSIVLYDDHYKRTWLGESHVLPHLRINNSAAAFRPIFKWNAWFTRYVTNCSRNLLTPVSLRQFCTMMPMMYSRRIGKQYRCLLLITPTLPTRSVTVFYNQFVEMFRKLLISYGCD